ncbi:hypothetical protein [Nitrincola sp. MINF-07-Sa-05]|uniref:hypothetical protein n=1 Tax=Nitrincola salilacus TaxID=3400273 RepID=UPI0039180157
MKLNEAIELGKTGRWQDAQVRVSPDNSNQWFVMLRDSHYKYFVLSDNDDRPIATEEMNRLADLIRSIGLKEFTVFL